MEKKDGVKLVASIVPIDEACALDISN